jgi:Flp pilus assembly protein TadD
MRIQKSSVPFPRPQKLKDGLARQTARYGSLAAVFAATLFLAGCQTPGQNNDITGSIPSNASLPASQQGLFRYTEELGARYDAHPNDKRIALTYARALQKSTRYAQAVAVLQRLAATYPKDREVLGTYGKALVDAGRLQEAADVLPQAHTPENPNWTILSAQGTVADQQGEHLQAQEFYQAALKIVPNQPDVLSNLGLSYALAKQLPRAESTLELAASQPNADVRVRQNLALVLALEGKFAQAQTVAQHDLPPLQAAENVASIRQMIAQANPWKQIRDLDAKPARRMAARRNMTRKVAVRDHGVEPSMEKTARITADQTVPPALR